ncbi:hypothetical protein ACFT5B_07010 [Luteimicrobium sp. NPDC057192]|uniref:hypothetical protein n=1 Tax=Luteimicrobium sp. NPDC057192 TaxID=3346042 RepID=UPI00362D01D0
MSPETEPGPWELMRMLRSMDGKLDRLVTRESFDAETRRVDDKFAAQGQDIVDERVAREKAIAELTARHDRTAANLRWVAAAILLPIALFIAGLVYGRGA